MFATLANGEVDCCLIPEIDWAAHGPNGVIEYVRNRLDTQGHAVVVLAEGAGQEFVTSTGADAGGNPKLGDIGRWFCKQLKAEIKCDVKYIDPTYMVRGCAANAHDSIMCTASAKTPSTARSPASPASPSVPSALTPPSYPSLA